MSLGSGGGAAAPATAPTPAAASTSGTPAAGAPWTPLLQMMIATCSVCVAAAAISFAVRNFYDARNAQLVQIGVDVLKVDPTKDKQVAAARRWALDLIDANAGVKFSEADRRELLDRPLTSAHLATEIGQAVSSAIRNSPQQ